MQTITYTSPYIPAEWIEAHGLRARRVFPGVAAEDDLDAMSGICPFARAFLNEANRADEPFVFTTSCDQMRRLAEFERSYRSDGSDRFLFNMPSTCETPASFRLYVDELRRLGEFLKQIGGVEPSRERLIEIMREHDGARRALREARGAIGAAEYARMLASYFEMFEVPPSGGTKKIPPEGGTTNAGIPLALLGSPVMSSHLDFFDLVANAGGEIVLDATASGERSLPSELDKRHLMNAADPLLVLAEAYFEIPSAFRRPNSGLYRYLKAQWKSRGVRGIVYRTCLWCDTWRAEAARIREWSGLPMVEIDVADEPTPNGSAMTRLQSFIEMLQ